MALDIDRYAHVESPINRWDPRVKLVALGLLIFSIALLKTIPAAIVAIIFAVIILVISALPYHFIMHGLSFVLVFLIPFFLIMPFTYPGEASFSLLGLPFAWEGLRLATLIFIKALSIVLLTFSIFGSSRFDVSMMAMQKMKFPKTIIQMLLFTYRYTFVFLEEMKCMHTSMKVRGFIARTDVKTLKIFGHFVGTLLVRSFERTERVFNAMLAKGYQGELHSMVTFESNTNDYVKALCVIVIAFSLVAGDYSGFIHRAEQGWY